VANYLRQLHGSDKQMVDYFMTEAASRGLYNSNSSPNISAAFARKNYGSYVQGNAVYVL